MKRSPFRIAAISFTVLAVLGLGYQYFTESRRLKHMAAIYDVTQPSIVRLTNVGVHRGADRIDILIEGNIDGKAVVCQALDNQKSDVHEISGRVSQRMGGAWHENSYRLKYEPVDVKSGELRIKYNFKD